MSVEEILARLISFHTVVGTANDAIVDWIRRYCTAAGAEVMVLPGPEGDRSNLFVTIGPLNVSGYILSGHMDVVSAGEPEWSADPFVLRRRSEKLFGRGTSDMKGFLACSLAALPRLAAMNLQRPIHLKAVRAHKGKTAVLEVVGRSGHSSRPDLGLNAVHAMTGLITQIVAYGEAVTEDPFGHNFTPPYSSLQIGVIAGGQAVNVIRDRCTADIEVRAVPGVSPSFLLEHVKKQL